MADWREELPEDLRAEPALKDIPDVVTLAKAFRDTKSMVGSSIRLPGADDASLAEFEAKVVERVPKLKEKLDQAQSLAAKVTEMEAKAKERSDAITADTAALKKEWGQDYSDKVTAAAIIAEKQGLGAEAQAMRDGSAPARVVKAFAEMARRMTGPGNEVGAQGHGGAPKLTQAEAALEIARLRGDDKYWNGSRAEAAAMHARVTELMSIASQG
jgi:hypothetical protein